VSSSDDLDAVPSRETAGRLLRRARPGKLPLPPAARGRPGRGPVSVAGILLLVLAAAPARADTGYAGLCEAAAAVAAGRHGVPLDMLRAIALVESGRAVAGNRRPWPWTVNAGGRGYWFASRESAVAFAGEHAAGAGIDIGCFQINTRWHGDAFASVEAMFDPVANANHAAAFLARLQAEFDDWEAAAGAYHSRTPHLAEAYRERLRSALAGLAPELPPPPASRAVAARPESAPQTQPRTVAKPPRGPGPAHPLFRAADPGHTGALGSLVVLSAATPPQPLIRASAGALR